MGGRFTRRQERILEESDFDEDWNLKEELWERDEELSKDPSFLAHAERLNARARAFLRDQGLPDCFGVSFSRWTPKEWVACEEMPDSVRLMPRRWLPLDFYLQDYRDVQDDDPEDLAARIVCKAYHLRHAVTDDARMWLAHELGELATLFNVYSQVGSEHEKLNERRHAEEKEAREKVLREWEKEPGRFRSADKAGLHYSDRLAKQGYTFEPRTVGKWIRDHKKTLGIK